MSPWYDSRWGCVAISVAVAAPPLLLFELVMWIADVPGPIQDRILRAVFKVGGGAIALAIPVGFSILMVRSSREDDRRDAERRAREGS